MVSSPSPSQPSSFQNSVRTNRPNQLTCFGCQRPGYIKSNYPTCSGGVSSIDFCCLEGDVAKLSPQPRPLFNISIMGLNGSGIINTAAKPSVASSSLH